MAPIVSRFRFSKNARLGLTIAAAVLYVPYVAVAQVAYDDRPIIEPFSPYDESYGVSPSFEIFPRHDGVPAVRVVERCQYPNGWNVTDFARDVNGIPAGVDHACRTRNVRERY